MMALLPALGMAVIAVRGRADQGRLAERSATLAAELEDLRTLLEGTALSFDRLREAMRRTRQLFTAEAEEWRKAAEYRQPLSWRPPPQVE
jgi:hypothetical protein